MLSIFIKALDNLFYKDLNSIVLKIKIPNFFK